MKILQEIIPMIDRHIEKILFHRILNKEKFMEIVGDERLYNILQNAKCGIIKVTHDTTGKKHYGFTAAFNEGIGCYMSNEDEWFTTSVIKHIDWENHKFVTLNSVYNFEFEDLDWHQLVADLQILHDNFLKEYESKSKEVE